MPRSMFLVAAAVAAASLAVPAAASAYSEANATFRAGSGNFLLTSGTDGLRTVGGTLKVAQANAGAPIRVTGSVSGLAASTPYVAVPYKDAICLPTPGVTAFPSGSWMTNAQGSATVNVVVNPQAIESRRRLYAIQTRSVSIRQAIVSAVTVPGIPIGTPTVPNAAPPETCDRAPVVRWDPPACSSPVNPARASRWTRPAPSPARTGWAWVRGRLEVAGRGGVRRGADDQSRRSVPRRRGGLARHAGRSAPLPRSGRTTRVRRARPARPTVGALESARVAAKRDAAERDHGRRVDGA